MPQKKAQIESKTGKMGEVKVKVYDMTKRESEEVKDRGKREQIGNRQGGEGGERGLERLLRHMDQMDTYHLP